MWLQKRLNKRFIKKAIWSDYIYQIEAEEGSRWWYDSERWISNLKSFLQDWVNEMKREIEFKRDTKDYDH